MCDTVVATPEVTADGIMLFGKNSDRDANEAQYLEHVPAQTHAAGSPLRCTYIEIPQVERTNAILLSRPFWMWGAEMGANEHGLVIGNEAIFSKVPAQQDPALLGMDLLRLALERAATAREGVDVITSLLEKYGQGGGCSFFHPFYYHNSFLLVDPREAWVLESVDHHWAAKQVRGVYAISNVLTLGNDFDLASPDLVSFAVQKGWCKGREDFDFSRCYSDLLYTQFSDSRSRRSCSLKNLNANKGVLTIQHVLANLRDHGEARQDWHPDKGIMGANVCMHEGWGPIRSSQSTASLAAHLDPRLPTFFATGTSAPCTGIFKPVWLDAGLPDLGPEPSQHYDVNSLFWRHEELHRATLEDYSVRIEAYRRERDLLESEFLHLAFEGMQAAPAKRNQLSVQCFERADQAEADWLKRVRSLPIRKSMQFLYGGAWKKLSREAKMPGV
jgi:dipeptidase